MNEDIAITLVESPGVETVAGAVRRALERPPASFVDAAAEAQWNNGNDWLGDWGKWEKCDD
jgi:hypothetical protein